MPPELSDDHVAASRRVLNDHDVDFVIIAGVAFDLHPAMLRDVEMMTLITEEGPLDLCFAPAGFPNGYDSLSKHASVIVVGAVEAPVASPRDIVTSKRAAGRPKDVVALPPLKAHLASRER